MYWGRYGTCSECLGEIVKASSSVLLERRLLVDSTIVHRRRGRRDETCCFVFFSSFHVAPLNSVKAASLNERGLWLKTPGCGRVWVKTLRSTGGRTHFCLLYFLAECRGHFGFFLMPCVTKSYQLRAFFVRLRPSLVYLSNIWKINTCMSEKLLEATTLKNLRTAHWGCVYWASLLLKWAALTLASC